MAFAATVKFNTVFGNKRIAVGQYTQASGDTGGAIVTGFSSLDYFSATNETKSTDAAGTVTIVTPNPGADQLGFWMAIGS